MKSHPDIPMAEDMSRSFLPFVWSCSNGSSGPTLPDNHERRGAMVPQRRMSAASPLRLSEVLEIKSSQVSGLLRQVAAQAFM